jgi:tRNA-dihydrouridine synthase
MEKRIYLAPIKGITDRVFRKVFGSCFKGIDAAVAPFITASDSEKKIKDLIPSDYDKFITIPQILTKSEEQFVYLAQKMSKSWN